MEERDHGFNMSVLAEYMHAVDANSSNVLETRLQFDKKWGADKKLKTKANITFEREFGDGREHGVELIGRIGAVYKVTRQFKPGIEWHGGFGKINKIGSFSDEQEHHLGPVVYGHFEQFKHGGNLEYQLGYLPGISSYAADHAFKFLLEYKYNF